MKIEKFTLLWILHYQRKVFFFPTFLRSQRKSYQQRANELKDYGRICQLRVESSASTILDGFFMLRKKLNDKSKICRMKKGCSSYLLKEFTADFNFAWPRNVKLWQNLSFKNNFYLVLHNTTNKNGKLMTHKNLERIWQWKNPRCSEISFVNANLVSAQPFHAIYEKSYQHRTDEHEYCGRICQMENSRLLHIFKESRASFSLPNFIGMWNAWQNLSFDKTF